MPPNCATSGFLPVLWTLTWKHRRRPYGVTTVVRYVRAIAVTVERCLAASVLSIEVNMTQCSRCSRHVTGQQVVLDDPPVFGPVDADDFVVVEVHPFGTMLGFAELEVGAHLALTTDMGTRSVTPLTDRRPRDELCSACWTVIS